MSLESKLGGNNVNSFFGKVLYKYQMDCSYGNHKVYFSRFDGSRVVVDKSGKIVFGGKHDKINKLVQCDINHRYLFAWENNDNRSYIYSEDGALVFGSPIGSLRYVSDPFIHNGKPLCLFVDCGTKNMGYITEDGKLVFKLIKPHTKNRLVTINGRDYLEITEQNDKCNFISEEGELYRNAAGPYLSNYKDRMSEFGLWDRLVESSTRIYDQIWGSSAEKEIFTFETISILKKYFKEHSNDQELLGKALRQFVQGLEYFAEHPDEALSFSGGGLGR